MLRHLEHEVVPALCGGVSRGEGVLPLLPLSDKRGYMLGCPITCQLSVSELWGVRGGGVAERLSVLLAWNFPSGEVEFLLLP